MAQPEARRGSRRDRYGLVDVNGHHPAKSPYVPLTPGRLLDSRSGGVTADGRFAAIGVRSAGSVTEVQVTGRAGVATNAIAAVLNVTVTGATTDGYVTVYPCTEAVPNASSLNFTAGQTVPNAVITKLSAAGTVCLYTTAPTDLLVDANGYQPG